MTREEIRKVVLRSLAKVAPEAETDAIEPGVNLRDQLDLDSMDFLNFMIGIHEATGVEIPEADYPQLSTLDGCIAYLEAKTRGK